MSRFVDLHTHTTVSDGSLTPIELLDYAATKNLTAIAITDHDTVAAYTPQTFAHAQKLGVELVPGIEFSTRDAEGNKYHILGLCIDPKHENLTALTQQLKIRRQVYTERVVAALAEQGWYVELDAIQKKSDVITKAHIARAVLEDERNKEKCIEVFGGKPTEGTFIETYLIKGCPAFVKNLEELSPEEAIATIHIAGGVAILAHPAFCVMQGENIDTLTEKFIALGIDGFEAINIQYDKSNDDAEVNYIQKFTNFATKAGLLISGGSDFHTNDESQIGKHIDLGFTNHDAQVPYAILEEIKEKSFLYQK